MENEIKKSVCDKCQSYDILTAVKPGSSKFEVTSWIILFPLGPFYTVWRFLAPKKKLCQKCLPVKKPMSPLKKSIIAFLIIASVVFTIYSFNQIQKDLLELRELISTLKSIN